MSSQMNRNDDRTRWRSIYLLLALTLGFASAACAQTRPKIAVMRFQSQSAAATDKVDALTAEFTRELAKTQRFTITAQTVVRQYVERVETEDKLSDPEKLAPKLGQLLQVDWVFVPYVTFEENYARIAVNVAAITTTESPSGYAVTGDGTIKNLYEVLPAELARQAANDPALSRVGIAVIPDPVLALLKRADFAMQRGRTADAIKALDDARAAAPDNAEVLNRCVGLYAALGKPDQALAALQSWMEKAGASHPQYDDMLKREFDLTDQLDELKRVADEAGKLLAEFSAAADKKDADAAVGAFEKLKGVSARHPALPDLARRLKELGRGPGDTGGGGKTMTVDLGGGIKLELVRIPAGEFLMGSRDGEEGRGSDEGPQHKVRISQPFYMGKYEVTNAQYRRFKSDHDSGEFGSNSLNWDDHPVVNVSWKDANAFCAWLSQRSGKPISLPTEAQWEYACRAGTITPFHYGATISSQQVNYDGTGTYGDGTKGEYRECTTRVGQFAPNSLALHDMHGNVWEWCRNWMVEYRSGDVTDPTGPWSGSARVLRGGSWYDLPRNCRSADRCWYAPEYRFLSIGFRVVSGSP